MEHGFTVLAPVLSGEERAWRDRYGAMLRRAKLLKATRAEGFSAEELPEGCEFDLMGHAMRRQLCAYFSVRTTLVEFNKPVPFAVAARIAQALERKEFDSLEIRWNVGGSAIVVGKRSKRSPRVLAAWTFAGEFPSPEDLDAHIAHATRRWRRQLGVLTAFSAVVLAGIGYVITHERDLWLACAPLAFISVAFPALVLSDKPGRKA